MLLQYRSLLHDFSGRLSVKGYHSDAFVVQYLREWSTNPLETRRCKRTFSLPDSVHALWPYRYRRNGIQSLRHA